MNSDLEQKEFTYILDCVIEHSEGINGGRYTSLFPIDRENNNWVRYSDENCIRYNIWFKSKKAIHLIYLCYFFHYMKNYKLLCLLMFYNLNHYNISLFFYII